MLRVLFFSVFFLSALWAPSAAQEVSVNGIGLEGVYTTLNITVDMLEVPRTDEPGVRLRAGHQHYQLALLSRGPVPMFDAEFSLAAPRPMHFSIVTEDGREFQRCLVRGLSSSGSEAHRQFVYSFACEEVSRPPMPCTACK
jgi:hypothetical protein